jgi:DNA-binding transcriptional ArsR family regulator
MKAITFASVAQAIAFRYTTDMTIARKTVADADADVFAALAHPIRRQLLDQLAGGGRSVKDLAAPFATTRQAISQHLQILLTTGLVEEHKQGRERVYQLQAQPLAEVEQWLASYRRFWRGRLGTLGAYLQEHHGEQPPDP